MADSSYLSVQLKRAKKYARGCILVELGGEKSDAGKGDLVMRQVY